MHDESEARQQDDLRAGLLIADRCRLEELIGRGGQGVIWRARDEQEDDAICALKFLHSELVVDPIVVLDLVEEIDLCKKLEHPSIIHIHRLLQDRKLRLVAVQMEHVAGGCVAHRCAERKPRRFEPEEIAGWLQQLCSALEHAHQAGIVHRDLKPANLLLDAEDRLKLADFGLARTFEQNASRHTNVLTPTGTLYYASPEQLRGYQQHATDDLYSLGATIYALLTSKPPFYKGHLEAVRAWHEDPGSLPPSMTQRRIELGQAPGAIPPEWEEVVAALLARKADRRPPSAAEVAKRLRAAVVPAAPVALESAVHANGGSFTPLPAVALRRDLDAMRTSPAPPRPDRSLLPAKADVFPTRKLDLWVSPDLPTRPIMVPPPEGEGPPPDNLKKEESALRALLRLLQQAATNLGTWLGKRCVQTLKRQLRPIPKWLRTSGPLVREFFRALSRLTLAEIFSILVVVLFLSWIAILIFATAKPGPVPKPLPTPVRILSPTPKPTPRSTPKLTPAPTSAPNPTPTPPPPPISDLTPTPAPKPPPALDTEAVRLAIGGGVREIAEGYFLVGPFGFIDSTGAVAIAPKWEEVGDFSEGLAYFWQGDKVERGASKTREASESKTGKCGYIDAAGKIVIPPAFDAAGTFSNGLANFRRAGAHGFIDRTGAVVIPAIWDEVGAFNEGLAAVRGGRVTDYKAGFIGPTGAQVIRTEWDQVWDFSEGLAPVRMGNKCGFIDHKGKVVIPLQWRSAGGFHDGLALVQLNQQLGYIDPTGKVALQGSWDTAGIFSEGLATFSQGSGKSAKWGYMDKAGKVVIQPQWSFAQPFAKGLAIVRNGNGKMGVINLQGTFVIPEEWDGLWSLAFGREKLLYWEMFKKIGANRALHVYLGPDLKEIWHAELPLLTGKESTLKPAVVSSPTPPIKKPSPRKPPSNFNDQKRIPPLN